MRRAQSAGLLTLAGLGGCAGQQAVLDAHGPAAEHLKNLIISIVGICALVFLLVTAVLMLAILRSRRGGPSRPATPERRMGAWVIAAVVGTVLIISAFTVASFMTTRAIGNHEADLVIRVRGQQW